MKVVLCVALLLCVCSAGFVVIAADKCCATGKYWDTTTSACVACVGFCGDCDMTTDAGDQNGKQNCKCKAANANCLTCDDSKCLTCKTGGSFVVKGDGDCAVCADAQCSTCDAAANSCTACNAGWYIENSGTATSKCTTCGTGCAKCKTALECTECSEGYLIGTTVTGQSAGCGACGDANAKTCDPAVPATAKSCMPTHYLKANATTCTTCGGGGKLCSSEDASGNPTVTGCSAVVIDSTTAPNRPTVSSVAYFWNSTAKTCTDCVGTQTSPSDAAAQKACIACTAATGFANCTTCLDSYWKDSAKCTICGATCKTCITNATTCIACHTDADATTKSYYTKKTANGVCALQCKTQPSSGQCPTDGCNSGYFSDSGLCTQCSTTLCNECTGSATACDACIADIGLWTTQSAKPYTCAQCVAGCMTCTDASNCTTCKQGFLRVSATTCSACSSTGNGNQFKCNVCAAVVDASSGTTNCTSCKDGTYYASGGSNAAVCTDCSSATCKDCQPATIPTTATAEGCTVCADRTAVQVGYALKASSNVACDACEALCAVCTTAARTTLCGTCVVQDAFPQTLFYYKSTSGTCASCGTNCTSCTDATGCKTCADGSYKTSDTIPVCTACDANSPLRCKKCIEQTVLGTKSAKCTECNTGFVLNSTTGVCGYCLGNSNSTTGCASCDTPGSCTTCADKFYLAAATCAQCTDVNCKTCSPVATCSACKSGYSNVPVGGTCEKCHANCYKCTATATCETGMCHKKYHNDSTTGCKACQTECNDCTDATACKTGQCIKYYFVDTANGSTCAKCPDKCEDCTDKNTCKASKCDDEYYVDGANGCKGCPSQCKTCDSSSCSVCLPGYVPNGNACDKCGANCNTCAKKSECADDCTSKTTFYYNATAKTCTSKVTCPLNEYDVANVCTKCGDKCLSCSAADACLVCMDKHGMKTGENQCAACTITSTGVKYCNTDLAKASHCDSGYGVKTDACVKCDVAGCGDCAGDKTLCVTCQLGYGKATDSKSCGACSQGCKTCSSGCKRSCTMCFESATKSPPNCECKSGESWNSATNTCGAAAATPVTVTTDSTSTSANILKFAVIVLIALIALL